MTQVTKHVDWDYPKIGTCGDPVDLLRISPIRVQAIDDLVVGFDGTRDGWTVGGMFRTPDGSDFEFKEVVFIPAKDMDENRFSAPAE